MGASRQQSSNHTRGLGLHQNTAVAQNSLFVGARSWLTISEVRRPQSAEPAQAFASRQVAIAIMLSATPPGRVAQTVFLKLSGELFATAPGTQPRLSIDHQIVHAYAGAIHKLAQAGIRTGVAVGGGNIYRGRQHNKMLELRTSVYAGDHMGLLATVINGVALKDVLVQHFRVRAQLFSEVVKEEIAERFLIRRLDEYWRQYEVLIFTGSGAPAVGRSSDSVAADTAVQLGAQLLLKATKVDGVYDSDPAVNPHARKRPRMTYNEVLSLGAGVMDLEAVTRCRDHRIPIRVFQFPPDRINKLLTAVAADCTDGTLISD